MTNKNLTRGRPLEEVADFMASVGADSQSDQLARSEFLLRQTQFLERQADAAEASARANEETARATLQYTKYMFWSVVVLAASAALTLLITLLK